MLFRKPFMDRTAIRDEKSTKADTRSGAADCSGPGSSAEAPAQSVHAENARLGMLSLGVFTVAKAAGKNNSSALPPGPEPINSHDQTSPCYLVLASTSAATFRSFNRSSRQCRSAQTLWRALCR